MCCPEEGVKAESLRGVSMLSASWEEGGRRKEEGRRRKEGIIQMGINQSAGEMERRRIDTPQLLPFFPSPCTP